MARLRDGRIKKSYKHVCRYATQLVGCLNIQPIRIVTLNPDIGIQVIEPVHHFKNRKLLDLKSTPHNL